LGGSDSEIEGRILRQRERENDEVTFEARDRILKSSVGCMTILPIAPPCAGFKTRCGERARVHPRGANFTRSMNIQKQDFTMLLILSIVNKILLRNKSRMLFETLFQL
jgi:hypothetical protein